MRESMLNQLPSLLRRLTGKLIANTKDYLVVRPLQLLFPKTRYEQKLQLLRSLPAHTVGNDLAKMLDEKGLKLIPGFERHDLNHLILGYGMEPEEELCMQAYLVGNGYYKFHCCLFLSSGLLLPCLWKTLFAHYQLGKRSESLASLSLNEYMAERTDFVIRKYRAATVNESSESSCTGRNSALNALPMPRFSP
ncbi:MAG: hypothetical protein ABL921_05545 [Pirellula sp.]